MNILWDFIRENTKDSSSTIEFGCGKGEKLKHAYGDVKIGLELYEPAARSKSNSFTIMNIDFRHYRFHIPERLRDTAMFIDSIEHIPKQSANKLLDKLQHDFDRILIFCPEGKCEQGEVDGNPYQKHLSTWRLKEFRSRDFICKSVKNYHGDSGAIFAVWSKRSYTLSLPLEDEVSAEALDQ